MRIVEAATRNCKASIASRYGCRADRFPIETGPEGRALRREAAVKSVNFRSQAMPPTSWFQSVRVFYPYEVAVTDTFKGGRGEAHETMLS